MSCETPAEKLKLKQRWQQLTCAPNGYEIERKLISRRFEVSSCRSIMSLNSTQNDSIAHFIKQLLEGKYRLTWHPCLCGNQKFTLIAEIDRYAIPTNTLICNRCGQVQSNPVLDEVSLASFYRRYYRAIYSGSATPKDKHFKEQLRQGKRIQRFFASHGFKPGRKIFEIGCGAGGILHVFKSSGHELYGCDFNDAFLECGRSRGLNLYAGDASSLRPHAKADLIILSHVIEHFFDPIKELNHINQLLADDGFVYIEVPNLKRLNSYYRADVLRFFQNAHNWHFVPGSLDRLMSACGYRRTFGNQKIRAIYQKNSAKPIPTLEGEAYRQLLLCRKHERRRPWLSPVIGFLEDFASRHRADN